MARPASESALASASEIASSASRAASSSDWPCARRVCSASSSAHSSAPGASLATSPICQASRSRSRSRSPCFSRASGERLRRRAPRRPERRERRGVDLRVRVEQGAHRGRARQPLPGVLAVDVDELVGRLAQLRDRRAAAVDPRPALALRVDRPAQQHAAGVAGIGVEAGVGEPGASAGGTSNSALISARAAPSRTTPASPRLPSASCSASTRIDLPAPVSPLSTDKPDANSISSASTMTKSRIARRCSIAQTPDAQCSLPRSVA